MDSGAGNVQVIPATDVVRFEKYAGSSWRPIRTAALVVGGSLAAYRLVDELTKDEIFRPDTGHAEIAGRIRETRLAAPRRDLRQRPGEGRRPSGRRSSSCSTTQRERWPGGISYVKRGHAYLCFLPAPGEHLAAGYHRKRVGLNHLAFEGASRAHVDEIAAWVRANGHAMLYESKYPYAGGPDYYALFCEDPDRIKVEVAAPR
jgi:catechol 2,3-dioxygenase-like lactoylglutathione lyase family enzyme